MTHTGGAAGPGAEQTYAGWIPNITGHLSFSLIGQAGAAHGCIAANGDGQDAEGKEQRQVVVSQRRVTQDWPFTAWPISRLFPRIAAEYLLLAKSSAAELPRLMAGPSGTVEIVPLHDDFGALNGKLFVIPHHNKRWWREYLDEMIAEIRRKSAKFGDTSPRGATENIEDLFTEIESKISIAVDHGTTILELSCQIYRTGEFRLTFNKDALPELISEQDYTDRDDRFSYAFANQAYYFVKDICHRHYHHPSTADNLLPATRCELDNDESWRRETLWSLSRAVLEVRRRDSLINYHHALGILAYADAFQSLLARIRRTPSDQLQHELSDGIATYDFAHTRQSIQSKIGEQSWSHGVLSNLQAVIVSAIIASIAIWVESVQILPELCHSLARGTYCMAVPVNVSTVLKYAIENPVILLSYFILLGVAYLQFTKDSLRSIPGCRVALDFTMEWSLATGATVSRVVRRGTPILGDWAGTIAALLAAVAFGAFWMWLFGAFFFQLARLFS